MSSALRERASSARGPRGKRRAEGVESRGGAGERCCQASRSTYVKEYVHLPRKTPASLWDCRPPCCGAPTSTPRLGFCRLSCDSYLTSARKAALNKAREYCQTCTTPRNTAQMPALRPPSLRGIRPAHPLQLGNGPLKHLLTLHLDTSIHFILLAFNIEAILVIRILCRWRFFTKGFFDVCRDGRWWCRVKGDGK